jgi:hypothetical protein
VTDRGNDGRQTHKVEQAPLPSELTQPALDTPISASGVSSVSSLPPGAGAVGVHDDSSGDDSDVGDVEVPAPEQYEGRRTKRRRAREQKEHVVHHRASVVSAKDRFRGTDKVPVSGASESEVLARLKDAARSRDPILKRNARSLLSNPKISVQAGPHRGGLGGGGMSADPKMHMTVSSGTSTYHLRLAAGRPPAELGGDPRRGRPIAERPLVQITPDSSGVSRQGPAARSVDVSHLIPDDVPSGLKDHVKSKYATKLLQYRHINYPGRPASEIFHLLLHNHRAVDPAIARATRRGTPLNKEVQRVALANGLRIKRRPRK